jgi:hypothetical protein
VNLKSKISVGAEVTRLEGKKEKRLLPPSPDSGATSTSSPTIAKRVTRHPSPATRHAFTLVEILVVVVLMSLIVLALMAVFSSTQAAFRASITQTDVLEGGRSVMGLIKNDFESLTPSFGSSPGGNSAVPVNFYVATGTNVPLMQPLTGSGQQRANVLENFFILSRQNTTWTGVGYVVDTASTNYLNPLYRFSMSTNVMAANPTVLYNNFLFAIAYLPIPPNAANLSHLIDGVVDLRVRAFGTNGVWITTNVVVNNGLFTNVWVGPTNPFTGGEPSAVYMYSNTLPESVEIQLGVLEDRTLQRAETWPNNSSAQTNYLAQHAGQVHLFRQRIPIRNVDPSAYQ